MSPRIIQIPLSGDDRKAQAKGIRRAHGLSEGYFDQSRLIRSVNALRMLLKERLFVTTLRDEGLDDLPLPILRRVSEEAGPNGHPGPTRFEPNAKRIPLESMLPVKQLPALIKHSRRYRRLACSISEIGVIEPLVVYFKPDSKGRYILLDGHKNRVILLDKGFKDALCILSRDDEAFTYNKRVNYVATIEEHRMIERAIQRGVSETKIAKALNVRLQYIRRRRTVLNGICEKAIHLLKDEQINPVTFDALRSMKPSRQIEASLLMKSARNFTSAYAKALLASTNDAELKAPRTQRPANPMTRASLTLMERELKSVQQDFRSVEASYGADLVDLVVARAYLSKLISNKRIARYLDDNHPEIFREFRSIVLSTSLDGEADPERVTCPLAVYDRTSRAEPRQAAPVPSERS